MRRDAEAQTAGLVALIGRPNAGKSTLMNALVGEKIAVVSSKPQTTRNRITGILTEDRGQAVFLDLPGVHRPMHAMNERMMREVRGSLQDVDLVLHLVDATVPWGRGEAFLFQLLQPVEVPVIGLLTKIDLVRDKAELLPRMERYVAERPGSRPLPISAVTGDGLDLLREQLFGALPPGPPMYPQDLTTTQTERFFVAEVIREKVLDATRHEVPYATGVVVESFEETPGLLRIEAVVYVEGAGQKAILIGKGGRTIKAIGSAARRELESLLGIKVYLGLRVKVHKRWRDDRRVLRLMEPEDVVVDAGASPAPEERS